MIQKVNNILKPLDLPVEYIIRPNIVDIGISYHFFNESPNLYGDGEDKLEGGSLQIDVFSTIDFTSVVNQIKALMKAGKFRLADMRDSDDSIGNVQYHHKIMIFNYSVEEVLNSGS